MRRVTSAGVIQISRLLNGKLRPDSGSPEADRRTPRALFRYLGDHDLLGAALGDDVTPALTLLAELAGSGAVRQSMTVRTQLLTARYLSRYGTDGQNQHYLSPLLTGSRVASLALAERGETPVGVVARDGSSSFLVTGRLPLAAGAAECDMVVTAVDTGIGLSLAVVDVDTEGVQLLRGAPGADRSSYEIQLDRVAITADQILGKEGQGDEHMQAEQPVALLTSAAIIVSIAEHAWQREAPQTRGSVGSDLAAARKALLRAASRYKNERSFLKASQKAERLTRTIVARMIEKRLHRSGPPQLIRSICSILKVEEHSFYFSQPGSSELTDLVSIGDREPSAATDGLTPPTIAELISSLPDRFRAERAADWAATFHFNLKGDPHPEWTVKVDNGRCQVTEGLHGSPDCVVRMKAETYIGIETGTVNPQVAFMTGRVKVSDLAQMMRYIKLFRPATPIVGPRS